jgi:hypothetical protein
MTDLNLRLARTRTDIEDDRSPAVVKALVEMRGRLQAAMRRFYKGNPAELRISQIDILIGSDRSASVTANMTEVFARVAQDDIRSTVETLANALPASALPCKMTYDIWHPSTGTLNAYLRHVQLGGRKVEPHGRTVNDWKTWLAYVVDTEFFIDDLVMAMTDRSAENRIFLPIQENGDHDYVYAPTREAAAMKFLIRGAGLHAIHALTENIALSDVLETHHLTGVTLAELTGTSLNNDLGAAFQQLSRFIENRGGLMAIDRRADHAHG